MDHHTEELTLATIKFQNTPFVFKSVDLKKSGSSMDLDMSMTNIKWTFE